MRTVTIWLTLIGICAMASARAEKSLVVDLSKSTVYAFDDGRLVRSLVINPGTSRNPTRPGRYRISQKVRKGYRSNLVNIHNKPIKKGELGAPMDYWMRLGGTGMGFHRSSLWRASGAWGSHGCLRMSRAGARWLFDWAPQGTSVVVRPSGVDLASAAASPDRKRRRVEIASNHVHSRAAADAREKETALLKSHRLALAARHEGAVKPETKAPKETPVAATASPKPAAGSASSKPAGSGDPTVSRVRPVIEEPVQAPDKKD